MRPRECIQLSFLAIARLLKISALLRYHVEFHSLKTSSSKLNQETAHGVLSLFGNMEKDGISFKRHHYYAQAAHNTSYDFQKNSFVLCVNFSGEGNLRQAVDSHFFSQQDLTILPQTVSFFIFNNGFFLERNAAQYHDFLTLQVSHAWLRNNFPNGQEKLQAEVQAFLDQTASQTHAVNLPISHELRLIGEQLSKPPIAAPALWFYAKFLEIISHTLLQPTEDFFCHRQKRLALQRIDSVKTALARDLETPPSLALLAREAGCSAAYLSRTFSEYTGMTITHYLKKTRLERAAELLRTGHYNVTEVALEVGYSSLSHFSKVFTEMFGTCPCTFGLI